MSSAHLWTEMKRLSEQILSLSLDDEQSAELLGKLQDKQAQLRGRLQLHLASGTESKPPYDIQELLELELQIRQKLHDKKDEFARHLQLFEQAGRAKSFYESSYTQTHGYFIDKQK